MLEQHEKQFTASAASRGEASVKKGKPAPNPSRPLSSTKTNKASETPSRPAPAPNFGAGAICVESQGIWLGTALSVSSLQGRKHQVTLLVQLRVRLAWK